MATFTLQHTYSIFPLEIMVLRTSSFLLNKKLCNALVRVYELLRFGGDPGDKQWSSTLEVMVKILNHWPLYQNQLWKKSL